MKPYRLYVYSSILALFIAAVLGLGMKSRSSDFNRTVEKALSASVNYDQEFIGMVDRLEAELARRASFGYEGGKDPMTGQVRRMVLLPPAAPAAPAAPVSSLVRDSIAAVDSAAKDPVRLTAIIFDAEAKVFTAVVINGERTFSVTVGDKVGARLIRAITENAIVMEGDSLYYRYDLYGKMLSWKK